MLRISVDQTLRLAAGALPESLYPAGTYWYAGSAQTGLKSRVARHLQPAKRLRWHIDYLLDKPEATVVGIYTRDAEKTGECEAAALLLQLGEAVPRFGASDCRCSCHLVRTSGGATSRAERELLALGFTAHPV